MKGEIKIHDLNPSAIRLNKSLGDLCGLKNLGVHLIEVEPGYESTEYHHHWFEEECVYILAGTATVTIGSDNYLAEAGDFIGFPVNGVAHTMRNSGTEKLVCLVIGQRLMQDVADYPNKKKRLYRNKGHWDLVDTVNVTTAK